MRLGKQAQSTSSHQWTALGVQLFKGPDIMLIWGQEGAADMTWTSGCTPGHSLGQACSPSTSAGLPRGHTSCPPSTASASQLFPLIRYFNFISLLLKSPLL